MKTPSKFIFYTTGYLSRIIPGFFFRWIKPILFKNISASMIERVDYYNKLEEATSLSPEATLLKNLKNNFSTAFYLDTYKYIKYFDRRLKFDFLFGDIIHIPDTPTIVKSRPISQHNQNSVVLKLNAIRHFRFVNDQRKFEDKKEMLVWRGNVLSNQTSRQILLKLNFQNPSLDIGHVNDYENNQWKVDRMSIADQLNYKYILSIEGNDVATNLKWIMSSNSLCFMCQPKYETWFMEGRLKANHHYVLIKDDYSDLEEKIKYYNARPHEALAIIENANNYVKQFKDQKQERLISLLVLEKYFKLTNETSTNRV